MLRLTPNATFTAGSAWYNTLQPVAGAFSTTFTFQLSGGNTSDSPADGIAFVIQNSSMTTGASSLTALGPEGCGIGFGGSTSGCTPVQGPQTGVPNSLAVEFNTYMNTEDQSGNSVSIQNCPTSPTGPNSVDPSCALAINSNLPITLADGNVHTVTISYSGPTTTLLDVIVDGTDLFPASVTNPSGGVLFNLASIGLSSGDAYVGFTGATGGGDDNQDILSWTFTPGAQTAVVSTTAPTVLSYPNASGVNIYSYTAQLTSGTAQTVTVQPILMTQAACDAIVQKSFWPARCMVFENAQNSGLDAAVMFAVTCSSGPCNTFSAELGTTFEFLQSENPLFVYPGILGLLNPFPGWLKGEGPNGQQPCTPPATGALFQSNQVDSFIIDGGKTTGKSGGTGSCWVATYDTPGEIWPGISISSPTVTTYNLNQSVTAKYTCSNPSTSQPATSATGPYLTAASCTQSPGTGTCTQTSGGLACTGTVNTSTKGLHVFTVTAIDSGGNQNLNAVIYNVK